VTFALPAVIRLAMYIRKPFLDRVAFNKKNILRRDGYTCQYCNRRGERLTVDHVVPRSRGGETTWINVVAACLRCNLRKGNRLPDESVCGSFASRSIRSSSSPRTCCGHPHGARRCSIRGASTCWRSDAILT